MRQERRQSPAADAVLRRHLEQRMRKVLEGHARFDLATRGRYATDASIYQMIPVGVVFPGSVNDVAEVLRIAEAETIPVIARGGGTSQNGQPIGRGLVIDFSRYLGGILDYDPDRRQVKVRPGTVLTQLNARLKKDGLFFPVEPSTASRCTIGGMAGNNSSGARSIHYGKMSDNLSHLDALLHDGSDIAFTRGTPPENGAGKSRILAEAAIDTARSVADEIKARFPNVQRRVGGYNLDALLRPVPDLPSLLVGSEGTLAISTAMTLDLSPLPKHRVMGVCHFPTFQAAMETTRHIVELAPVAVELVDNNVLTLGADLPDVARVLEQIIRGRPDSLLLVEFAGETLEALNADLRRLDQLMADHGFPNAVTEVLEPAQQAGIWSMREACLNIMMSMKGDGKPVSFIEDCAVPLEHLASYTASITELFERHGTPGTWYAHASVGCLHVRPILNMKTADGARKMRAIADEAFELVQKFKGSHSGEHGDGISRSEFHEMMFGRKLVTAFETVKHSFDPKNRLNPGKIVHPLRMDDRDLFRFKPEYQVSMPQDPVLDWSEWGGFGPAVEMCNNNGTCRKLSAGTMCPSYRVTGDERHVTRGRANTLRLAMSGQLGPDAFTDPEMKETLDLCVSCKGCRRECPTGVDMARIKIEFLHHYHRRHGTPLRERLVAHLPDYAPWAARLRQVLNLRDTLPGAAWLSERMVGLSAQRSLPRWHKPWAEPAPPAFPSASPPASPPAEDWRRVILFGDTFNRYFEPGNLADAANVLDWFGYQRHPVAITGRPLCCGRTFLSAGNVARARAEAERLMNHLRPLLKDGARIVGLEPSCLLTMRDEFAALLPSEDATLIGRQALLLEELVATDMNHGRLPPLPDRGPRTFHLHGHCHQKSFGCMSDVEQVLRAIPGADVRVIESSCCGMAGAFGYAPEHQDISRRMAEAALFPALRAVPENDVVVADGTSCRHQIADGLGRGAVHVAHVLACSIDSGA